VASEAQPLDSVPLIRRKRAGEGAPVEDTPQVVSLPPPPVRVVEDEAEPALLMKPRDVVQLAAIHVRIPEQLARGLRLMSVLEGRQAQVIVAEMLEQHLSAWNKNWRDSVPPKG
jgi:hypothetical protein